ncbi:glycine-rich RNA-binding protein 4, mitochondrial-like [Magnolia sinica]|uniref:glycine-rich RNA-binding protein 4, mitochondrial-like n=1 Tax=Magnolia sinica TaxID=86752 RepID=UPI00265951C0|nr:glycine-rich RNA-binding protein 4, mitochondrial-like [Magnolia sinica]
MGRSREGGRSLQRDCREGGRSLQTERDCRDGGRSLQTERDCREGKREIAERESLSYDTNETVLKGAFERYGEIHEAVKVICDHTSAKSKGFGFVWFCLESEASRALQEMDDQLLDGRNIRVVYAKKG